MPERVYPVRMLRKVFQSVADYEKRENDTGVLLQGISGIQIGYLHKYMEADKAETEKVVLEEVKACLRKMLQSGLPKQEKMDADGQTEKKEIARIDRELKSIAGKLADLYQDTAEGILNDADYLLMRNEFSARKSKLEAERESLVHIVSEKKRKPKDTAVQSTLKKYLSAKKLDRTMVECFVEKVIVHEGRDIKVKILEPEEILRRMGV